MLAVTMGVRAGKRAIRMVWEKKVVEDLLAEYAQTQDWVDMSTLTNIIWDNKVFEGFFETKKIAYKNVIRYISMLQANGWMTQYGSPSGLKRHRNLYKPTEEGYILLNSELGDI